MRDYFLPVWDKRSFIMSFVEWRLFVMDHNYDKEYMVNRKKILCIQVATTAPDELIGNTW